MSDELWPDEAFNWYVAKDGWQIAIERIQGDFFPPLYSVVVALWLELAPSGALSLRLPSMIAGLLLVYAVYVLVTAQLGRQSARYAAFFVAFSPFFAGLSQIVRPFALDTVAIIFAVFFAYRFVTKTEQDIASNWRLLIGLFVSLSTAVHTNHGSVFFVFFSFWLLAYWCYSATGTIRSKKIWLLAVTYFLVFVFWLPELPILLEQRARSVATSFVEHQPQLIETIRVASEFFGTYHLWSLKFAGGLLLVGPAILGFFSMRKANRFVANFLAFLLLGYIAFLLVLSFFDPVFGRVLQRSQWLGVIGLIFAAYAYAKIIASLHMPETMWGWGLQAAKLALLLGCFFVQLVAHKNTSEMVRGSQVGHFEPFISQHMQETDIVSAVRWVFHSSVRYYMPGLFVPQQFQVSQESAGWTVHNIPEQLDYLREKHCAGGAQRVWLFVAGGSDVAKLKTKQLKPLLSSYTDDGRVAVMLLPLDCHLAEAV